MEREAERMELRQEFGQERDESGYRQGAIEGKETIFFHRGNMVPSAKFSAWQKRIIASSPANPHAISNRSGTTPLPDSIHDPPTTLPDIHHQFFSQTMDLDEQDYFKQVASSSNDESPSLMLFESENLTPGDQILASFFAFGPSPTCKLLYSVDFPTSPDNHAAALQYYSRQIFQYGEACQFQQEFINNLFYYANIKEGFANLESSVSLALESQAGYKALPLVYLLGQALAKNKDYVRMPFVARIMSTSVSRHRRGPSPAYFAGRWPHRGGHYEESIPYLEDAVLDDLDNLDQIRYSHPFMNVRAPEILLRSYEQLASAETWRAICSRVLGSRKRSFSDRLRDQLLQTCPFQSQAYIKFTRLLSEAGMHYIKTNRLLNLFAHIFPPRQFARISIFYYLRTSSFREEKQIQDFALHLQLAIQSLDPKDPVWHCESCHTGLSNLVTHIPRCIKEDVVKSLYIHAAFETISRDITKYILAEDRERIQLRDPAVLPKFAIWW
ncbi:uncharacterized protein PAC_16075 [Phialocephala subalpina]|uniref:Uncharacterized protein n=1 Tax=Phialocephala subalpina TaxID=576137 RepID=A0A1L7XMD8_9HELO|nr:uncharacterized protein PAC_16075 [Phialocephala subalpina]